MPHTKESIAALARQVGQKIESLELESGNLDGLAAAENDGHRDALAMVQ